MSASVEDVATSVEDLRAIAAKVREEARVAGELSPPIVGMARWDVPESVRAASLEELATETYDRAAAKVTHSDPDLT
jgi:hypothetical protein